MRAARRGQRHALRALRNEPYLIAGVATRRYEVLTERPDTDVVIPPLAAAAAHRCGARREDTAPEMTVYRRPGRGAAAAYNAWHESSPRSTDARRRSRGLATRTSFDLPQRMLAALLDDFVLVSDDELYAAMRLLLIEGHIVAEGAGAAPVAAARRWPNVSRASGSCAGSAAARHSGLTQARAGSTLTDPSRAAARYHREDDRDCSRAS